MQHYMYLVSLFITKFPFEHLFLKLGCDTVTGALIIAITIALIFTTPPNLVVTAGVASLIEKGKCKVNLPVQYFSAIRMDIDLIHF